MQTRHFIVRYEQEDPFLAKLLAETAEDELKRVARNLGYKPGKKPFKLYVFRTHVDFIEAGGLETSKFTVGTTTLSTDEIAVDASGVFDIPERIIAHEITHAIIFRMLGHLATVMPLWAHEGIAKYESREPYKYDEEMIASAAAEGSLIPLMSLRNSFPKTRMGLAYAESASAIRYLISKYGRGAPRNILKEIMQTASFDLAMYRVTGHGLDQFEREWLESVSKKYRGLRMIRFGTAFISSFMAALAVIAYLTRRKQKMEQVDEDEHRLYESNSEDEEHTRHDRSTW
ncbi:MAG: peptidase MA family metallohydrolase [Armatimonadota bacterium]